MSSVCVVTKLLVLHGPLSCHLSSNRYHLKDVIVGKIYFLLVRIKIKHMEIDIIKRETTGTGPSVYHENDTIAKYEIMDGAPVRGTWQISTSPFISTMKHFLTQSGSMLPNLSHLSHFRRVYPHPVIPSWLWSDSYHARHQQEVLGALLPELGADRWRGETLLQTAGDRKKTHAIIRITKIYQSLETSE